MEGPIYAIAFYLIAALAIASAVMVVVHRHPVVNALYLAVCFFGVAAIYVMLQAHFLAAIQVLVYAGAVLVLFVMIVMLINQRPNESGQPRVTVGKFAGGFAALAVGVMMVSTLAGFKSLHVPTMDSPADVVWFLVQNGANPDDFDIKFSPESYPSNGNTAGRLQAQSYRKIIAASLMADVADDQLKPMIVLPESYVGMTDDQLEREAGYIIKGIQNLGEDQPLAELKIDASTSISEIVTHGSADPAKEALLFVNAVADARARQFQQYGTTKAVGEYLFSRFALPFEAAGVLLLAAIIGVMVLARREGAMGGS